MKVEKKELIAQTGDVSIFTLRNSGRLSEHEIEEVHIEIGEGRGKQTYVVTLDVMGYDWEGGLGVERRDG